MQSCAVSIQLNKIPVVIAAIYYPPKHNITLNNLSNYFDTINNTCNNFIIGGDYNAKHQSWGCRVNNPRGNLLYNFINAKNFKILSPPGPTYWPTSQFQKPDILDMFVSKIPSNLYCLTNNILDLNSDHSPVLLNISGSPLLFTEPKLFSASTNRYMFHNLVDQQINLKIRLKNSSDIDEAVNNLTKIIHSTAAASTTTTNKPTQMHPSSQMLPAQIRSLIVEKRRARAQYQYTRLPSHKSLYNKLARSLKKDPSPNKIK